MSGCAGGWWDTGILRQDEVVLGEWDMRLLRLVCLYTPPDNLLTNKPLTSPPQMATVPSRTGERATTTLASRSSPDRAMPFFSGARGRTFNWTTMHCTVSWRGRGEERVGRGEGPAAVDLQLDDHALRG